MLSDVARAALMARSEKSSVFTQANIYADVERQLHGVLFAPGERTKVSERAVEAALGLAVKLSPPELAHVPAVFRSPDGTSQFAPATTWQYTTAELLEAEARLLDAGRDTSGPVVSYGTVARVCEQPLPGRSLRHGRRPGGGGGANSHLGARLRSFGWPGRYGENNRPGGALGRLGSRARGRLREGPGPLGGRRRQPGKRARHRH